MQLNLKSFTLNQNDLFSPWEGAGDCGPIFSRAEQTELIISSWCWKCMCVHTYRQPHTHTLTLLYQCSTGPAHFSFINTLINFSWSPFPACLINCPSLCWPTQARPEGNAEPNKTWRFLVPNLTLPEFIMRRILCVIHNSTPQVEQILSK